MATLPRPGVEISQEIIVESPTVLTPALVPAIIGPCFQIVNPIDEDGALNPQASVSTAARAVSTADLSEPLNLRGREFIISVNNGSDQVISMPAAVNGDFSMSFALVVNTINKQLTGAIAEITPGVVDGVAQPSRLVFRTVAKGPTASITLKPHPSGAASSAYGAGGDDIVQMNALEGLNLTGQTNYTNVAYDIPYTSLPSPMTSADECVWQGSDISVYRFFANSLYELSTDSAVNWNSYSLGASADGGGNDTSNAHQPVIGNGRTVLWGKPGTGSKTNTLCNPGAAASVTIPLAHNISSQYAESTCSWPDVTGSNFLKVEALGLQTYLSTKDAADVGNLIGAAGNAVTVEFSNAAMLSVSWNPGLGVLSIACDESHTYAELTAALEAPAFVDAIAQDLLLTYSPGDDATPFRGFAPGDAPSPWVGGAHTFQLHGGSDPVNFGADASAAPASGDDERQGWVAGAVAVGTATADALGLGGEILNVSIDGAVATAITLTGGAQIATTINNALSGVGGCATENVVNSNGETVSVLRIHTDSQNGHDSTIELSSPNNAVIERLFGGSQSGTDTVTQVNTLNGATPPVAAAQRRFMVQGGFGNDFNLSASTAGETAIQSGSISMTVDGLALASLRSNAVTDADVANAATGMTWQDAEEITITTDSGSDVVQLLLGTNVSGMNATVDNLIAEIDDKISVAMTTGGDVICHEASGRICFTRTELNPAAGQTVQIDTANVELAALLDGLLATEAATEATSLTIKDDGSNNALQVHSSTSDLTGPCPVNTPDGTSAAVLSEYFLGGSTEGAQLNRGYDLCLVEYSTGGVAVTFAGENQNGAPAAALPCSFALTGGSALSISYHKTWACSFGDSPSYTSRLFHGRSNRVMASDVLWNKGSVLGRVVQVNDWAIGGGFPGAELVISEFALEKAESIDGWYVVAENLIAGATDNAGNNIRPEPEAEFNDLTQVYSIKPGVNRNSQGIAIAGSSAPVYAQVKALRKDVTADTANPGMLVFSSAAEVESLIGPISPDNPLAFGLYLAFLNTSNISVSGLGVSDVSPDAPNGTLEAYAEALDFLALNEVYALAPMTDDIEVFKKFSLHVSDMSEPQAKHERMFLCCPSLPTEEESSLVGSADFMISDIGGGKYELSIADEAAAAAFNIPMAIDGLTNAAGSVLPGGNGTSYLPSDGIYVDRAGDAYRYLITGTPSSDTVVIETGDVYVPGLFGPATSGNDDSYYRTGTDALDALSTFEVDGELCTIKVRQAAIDMSGTAGKLKACETLAEIAGGPTGFQNRRMVMVQPEQVGTLVNGLEVLVPGHYLCAGIAGMIGQQNPSQPFTNLPMVGYTRPVGSSDTFSENQMATAAAGGIYWVIQDVPGAPLASRHQLTTDVSSLKSRELSILKAVDFVAKLVRAQLRRYIGRNNITQQLMETVSLTAQGALANVSGSVVARATLDKLEQSKNSPDEILATISVTPFYPANRIKITIVV